MQEEPHKPSAEASRTTPPETWHTKCSYRHRTDDRATPPGFSASSSMTTMRRAHLVPDAHLAALAIEHGVTVHSFDTDFARFPRWSGSTR